MKYIKADTSTKVVIGPVVAVGDGFTPVTNLDVGTADEAEILKHDASAVTDISGNTFAAIASADGYYNLTLTAAQLDTEGRLTVLINDDSLCLPVRSDFMVVNANVYDSLFAAATTDYLQTDITQVGGATTNVAAMATNVDAILTDTGTTLDNHLTDIKGTGFVKDTHSLIDIEGYVDLIDDGTSGLAKIATDAAAILDDTGTSGVLLAGTATSAQLVDDIWDEPTSGHNSGGTTGKALRNAGGIVLHAGTADAGGATTIDLETGSAVATDDYYNHTVIILTGGTGAGQERLISDYTGSSQQATITPAWAVNPDATSEYEIIPGTVHAETQGGGYAGGAVWIGPSGSTGAQLYVDGTVDNPIDDGQMANAKIVADALNLRIFRIEPSSSITLGETLNGYSIEGVEYTLNLGTQDVSNTYINGANVAASTATGTGTIYYNCIFDNAVTLAPCVIRNSYLGDTTITAGSAGNFFINHCVSRAAGSAVAPNFDFGAALNASNLNIRDWNGGIELENMGAGTGTYNCSIEGMGQVIINANCSATSNLAIRGAFTLTDNAGGAVTLSDDARIDVAQINAEADTAISDAALATAAALTTAQNDLDTITGSDGVTLATAQGNYAPATATALTTAQNDLDTITGSDGVTLATTQGNYAPATAAAMTTAQTDLDTITGSDGVTLATAQGNYAPSTTTEIAAAKENIDWALTVLVGALSNAGTATETYTFTVDGVAYTVTYAGLDADGNRGTTVLSKV